MVDDVEVFRIADAMFAEGERVSIRAVIRQLPDGGSHFDVGAALHLWKNDHPEFVSARASMPNQKPHKVDAWLIDLWSRARREAKAAFDKQMEIERVSTLQLRTEAFTMADLYKAEVDILKEKVIELEAEMESKKLYQRKRSAEFWDRVVHEIAADMPSGKSKTPKQMLDDLADHVKREATLHVEPLTPATIRKKILMRVTHNKLFANDPDLENHFVLRPDAKVVKQAK